MYTFGQLPLVDGVCTTVGELGETVTVDQGADAARLCTLNGSAAVHALVGLDTLVRVGPDHRIASGTLHSRPPDCP
ncbi:hypothetical protein GCM10011588_34890 [Nocardia jinanensis]|uniref:Uncharacterized protein n=1 Tax=Nocardia jinanensis TaxID=382504 RepID=A0A917RPQ2_9NOCA|nr:hypothetical protein GCM10011588_34890 [Nocardia jinanensis]